MDTMKLYRTLQTFVGNTNILVTDLYNSKSTAEEVEAEIIPILEELLVTLKKK